MIFYFSATGNTEWAARTIARATDETLVSIPEHMGESTYTLARGEAVGFCLPVHGWRPPSIVLRFVRSLHITNAEGHYAYILCTAGDTTGETFSLMQEALHAAGIDAQDWYALLLPESYVGLPFMDVDTPDNEQRKKRLAALDLDKYIQHIKDRTHTPAQAAHRITHAGRWPRINSRILGPLFMKYLVSDRRFRVVAARCTGCGRCAAVCPVSDIRYDKDRRPRWIHNGLCMTCFACYHHCPAHAIEFGHQTLHKGQYFYTHKTTPTTTTNP